MPYPSAVRSLVLGVLGCALLSLPADAQRPDPRDEGRPTFQADLFALPKGVACDTKGGQPRAEKVSVGRQLYTQRYQLYAGYGEEGFVTCEIDTTLYQQLNLSFGVADSTNNLMEVRIYQGGNVRYSYARLSNGRAKTVSLNLNDPKVGARANQIAIDIRCFRDSPAACYLRFVDATLLPASNITAPRVFRPAEDRSMPTGEG